MLPWTAEFLIEERKRIFFAEGCTHLPRKMQLRMMRGGKWLGQAVQQLEACSSRLGQQYAPPVQTTYVMGQEMPCAHWALRLGCCCNNIYLMNYIL